VPVLVLLAGGSGIHGVLAGGNVSAGRRSNGSGAVLGPAAAGQVHMP